MQLHFDGILPLVCPTADDSQFSGLAVFAGSLQEANAIMGADPAVEAACSRAVSTPLKSATAMLTYEIHPVRSF